MKTRVLRKGPWKSATKVHLPVRDHFVCFKASPYWKGLSAKEAIWKRRGHEQALPVIQPLLNIARVLQDDR